MYKVGLVTLLVSGSFINSFDRASLSTVAPVILKEFKLDPGLLGIALSAFFWPYFLLQIPVGTWADKYGAKKVMGWGAVIWSAASAATGLVQGLYSLVLARAWVGAGEAAAYPTLAKIVGQNFSSNERGTIIGSYISTVRLAMAMTPAVMAFLISTWGWREAFFCTGIASLLWCVFWYFGYKEVSERNDEPGVSLVKHAIPWKRLLTQRGTIGLVLAKFFQDYLLYLFVTWIPTYLVMSRGFSIIKMGIYASLPWIAGFIAQPLVGYLSDSLIKKGLSVTKARKRIQVGLQICAAAVMGVGFIDSPMVSIYLLTFAVAAESGAGGLIWAFVPEVSPKNMAGSIGGIMNAGGALAGIIAPIVTGFIVKFTGSFRLALAFGGISLLFAACSVLFVVPELKPMEITSVS
jgi:ACS family glucarate transporter-like MFS transporter